MDKIELLKEFIEGRRAAYQEELASAETDVERFVFSELVSVMNQLSDIIGED